MSRTSPWMPTKTLTAQPRSTPNVTNFLSISDEQLVRHPDIAYEDGYADARTWGKDGYFISSNYSEQARLKYLQGFKAGLRVFTVTAGTSVSVEG